MYCLVDYDPHGIDIFLNYRDGSRAMSHEQERLALFNFHYIGVNAMDLYTQNNEFTKSFLTLNDRAKASSMLKRADQSTAVILRQMLFMGYKIEIQALQQIETMEEYILSRTCTDCL